MEIKREKLLNVLSKVKPGLASKEIVEQTTHFVFTGDDVVTYNDFICIIHPFPTDFTCSVPASDFYKILQKITKEDITIEHKDGKIMVKAGKTRGGVSTQTGEKLMNLVDRTGVYNIKKFNKLPEDFIPALTLCMFSASRDHSDKIYGGICIDNDLVLSADTLRMTQFFLGAAMGGTKFNLPIDSIEELIKFPVTSFQVVNGMAFFRTDDDVLFCVNLINATDFPALDDYFDFDGIKFELPEDFAKAVDTALVMVDGDTEAERLIEVEIDAGNIRCRGENNLAWIENELDAKLNIEKAIRFSINPFFLLKILAHTRKMVYGADRAMFYSKNFKHLIALKPCA